MLQDYRQISSPLCHVIKAAEEKKRGPDARWAERGPAQERICRLTRWPEEALHAEPRVGGGGDRGQHQHITLMQTNHENQTLKLLKLPICYKIHMCHHCCHLWKYRNASGSFVSLFVGRCVLEDPHIHPSCPANCNCHPNWGHGRFSHQRAPQGAQFASITNHKAAFATQLSVCPV